MALQRPRAPRPGRRHLRRTTLPVRRTALPVRQISAPIVSRAFGSGRTNNRVALSSGARVSQPTCLATREM